MYSWTTEYNKKDQKWLKAYYEKIVQKEDEFYDKGLVVTEFHTNSDRITTPMGEWQIYYNGSGSIELINYTNYKTRSFVVYEIE